jgi:hypothetical protein
VDRLIDDRQLTGNKTGSEDGIYLSTIESSYKKHMIMNH